jgi:hypothetical protein
MRHGGGRGEVQQTRCLAGCQEAKQKNERIWVEQEFEVTREVHVQLYRNTGSGYNNYWKYTYGYSGTKAMVRVTKNRRGLKIYQELV